MGAGIKDTEKIVLISSPENDLMLTDDLLNKYRFGLPNTRRQALQTYPV